MSHLHHKVSALIDGELSPNARTRALAHARGCAQCRQEIAETLEIKRRVNQLAPAEVSGDLLDVVGSITIPAGPDGGVASRPALFRRVFVGVGSFSAVVVALAYVVGAPQGSQAATVSPPIEEFTAEFADSTGLAPLSDPAVGGLDAQPASGGATSLTFTPVGKSQPRPLVPRGSSDAFGAPLSSWASGDDPAALDQIGRALQAPQEFAFAGALVIRSFTGGGIASFRIRVEHVPGQGTTFDVLRHNGHVRAASFVKEGKVGSDRLDGEPLDALASAYDLGIDGGQEVDGRATTVVSASRHGEVTARFWIDVKTGLLLQRALYADGQLVRWSGYSAIKVTQHDFMSHLPPELDTPNTTQLPAGVAAALNDKGWTCPDSLSPDFRLSLLHQIDTNGGVMRAEYTDGLSNISIYEERGTLDTSALVGFRSVTLAGTLVYVKAGLPMVAVWEAGGMVFTAVTDAPRRLAEGLITRLPHAEPAPAPGVTSRIGHGLSRLASAVSSG